MAGRGTDIKLGDGVAELGGLHVIFTEMHDAARIDRQIDRPLRPAGRSRHVPPVSVAGRRHAARRPRARQGRAAYGTGRRTSPGPFDPFARSFRKAQRIIERRHFRDRRALMYHEKERKKMQKQMGQDPYLDTPS